MAAQDERVKWVPGAQPAEGWVLVAAVFADRACRQRVRAHTIHTCSHSNIVSLTTCAHAAPCVLACSLYQHTGTDFIVDGFAFQSPRCRHYFLTHMHSDHTVGLRRSFDAGTIWASPVSARLLAHEWSLRAPTVQVLQLNQPRLVDGVRVTALDANHCPGALCCSATAAAVHAGWLRLMRLTKSVMVML